MQSLVLMSWSGKSSQVGRGDAEDGGGCPGGTARGEPEVEQACHTARLAQEATARGIQVTLVISYLRIIISH